MMSLNTTQLFESLCQNISCIQVLELILAIAQKSNISSQSIFDDISRRSLLPVKPVESATIPALSRTDATWQLRSAFTIMTMQSGFALLETGCVSTKNIANTMVKNVVDVAFGGLSYWMFGYGLSFGGQRAYFPKEPPGSYISTNLVNKFDSYCASKPTYTNTSADVSNNLWSLSSFFGSGSGYFINSAPSPESVWLYTHYFFHFSFASTATTIVSGAVAERMTLHSYMLFSFFNTLSYCVAANWVWAPNGFLKQIGFYDFAGVCAVHVKGGSSAIVAALMLGSRHDRWIKPEEYQMTSPVTALAGTLMLWWSWFSFNAGSSGGVEGDLYRVNALVSVNTLHGSVAGGLAGIGIGLIVHRGTIRVETTINGILGGLVALTGSASILDPAAAFVVGAIGAIFAITAARVVTLLRIDDPVGAIAVHYGAGIWGTLVIGLVRKPFASSHVIPSAGGSHVYNTTEAGLFFGGGPRLLGVQLLGTIMISTWSAGSTALILIILDRCVVRIRMSATEEKLGADLVEHGIYKSKLSETNKLDHNKRTKTKNNLENRRSVSWTEPLPRTDDSSLTDSVNELELVEGQPNVPWSRTTGPNFGALPSRATVVVETMEEVAAYEKAVRKASRKHRCLIS